MRDVSQWDAARRDDHCYDPETFVGTAVVAVTRNAPCSYTGTLNPTTSPSAVVVVRGSGLRYAHQPCWVRFGIVEMRAIQRHTRLAMAASVGVLVMLTVIYVPFAEAHQPMHNPGSPDQTAPFLIPAPTVSRAIRGVLPPGGRDFYALELARSTAITLWLLTPMVDACNGFEPVMRIWHEGAHRSIADRWDGNLWFRAVTSVGLDEDSARGLVAKASPWGRFEHGGERSNSGPYLKPVLGPGAMVVSIEAPLDRGGAYTFAPGDLEIPGGYVDPELQALWRACPDEWDKPATD